MIENPRDERGNPIFVPDAPAPDPATHIRETHEHVRRMARCDARYARWVAGTMGKECPEWYGDLLPQLDEWLSANGIPIPAPYVEPASKVPAPVKGRALPKKRFFHDHPDCR